MATVKELSVLSKNLSILYYDENNKILDALIEPLKLAFSHVDEASDITTALGSLKFNSYDIVVVDSQSSSMSSIQLVKNIYNINKHQNLILTSKNLEIETECELYRLGLDAILKKPFKSSELFDCLYALLSKKISTSNTELEKLNETLLYERKRIGRFMLNEKKLNERIDTLVKNKSSDKNIYDLTGLPSKYALQTAINSTPQSLLYLNIDYFDIVNNVFGMARANNLLRECSLRLKQFLPINAELFHITADEFVILLSDITQEQDIFLAKQIQALFGEASIKLDNYSHKVVFSIGIDRGEGKSIFLNAKYASKEARHFGGNQIVFYNKDSDYMREQKESLYWIGVLQQAFEDDNIYTYYQPIINHNNPEIKHYEVLCRIKDQNNKMVDASKFIYSAKMVGLMSQITKIVIDKTFKLFTSNDYNFSLNISMYDLHGNYLYELLKYKCQKYNIDYNRVYLEVIEDIIISKSLSLDKQILDLKELGFHVVIDDFATDRSTFSRVFDLKAEFIKIDGSFIKELARDSSYKTMVQSIVEFAKKSGIKTIAEHVETHEVYEIVKELEIDYAQGYLLAKPSMKL